MTSPFNWSVVVVQTSSVGLNPSLQVHVVLQCSASVRLTVKKNKKLLFIEKCIWQNKFAEFKQFQGDIGLEELTETVYIQVA